MLNDVREIAFVKWSDKTTGTHQLDGELTAAVKCELALRTVNTFGITVGMLPKKNSRIFNKLLQGRLFSWCFGCVIRVTYNLGCSLLRGYLYLVRKCDLFLRQTGDLALQGSNPLEESNNSTYAIEQRSPDGQNS